MSATNSPRVEVVVFAASWAPASGLVARALAAKAGAKAGVRVVDVDSDFGQAEAFRVICVPTVVVCVDGEEKRRLTGAACVGAMDVAAKVSAGLRTRR